MTSSIYFTYSGQSHYDCAGNLTEITYRYVAYPKDQKDTIIGIYLNDHFTAQQEVLSKKMIENLITKKFESACRKVHKITFDDNYQDTEYYTLLKTDFCCIVENEYE